MKRHGYYVPMIGFFMRLSFVERALWTAVAASGAVLIAARLFESLGGYAPCELCLDQRQAHWTALSVAAAGLFANFVLNARLAAAGAVGATALVYAVGAGLAFYHTGVEYHFWPGPQSCTGAVSLGDVNALATALAEKVTAPRCDVVAWRLFGISMAGYNLLISAGLFALMLLAALDAARQARRARRPEVGELAR